jgi:hypothetical protein
MVCLHSYCKKWGDQDCHPDVKQWFHSPRLANGEELPTKREWKGMDELDAICGDCENRLFMAESRYCIICESTLLKSPMRLEYRGEEAHRYKCVVCNTPYLSTSELT